MWTVLNALREWGDEWVVGTDKAAVVLVHDDHRCTTEPHCAECGHKLGMRDVHLEQGPGADATTVLAGRDQSR